MGLVACGLFGLSSQAGAVDGPGIGALTYQSSEVTGQAPIKVIYSTCKDYPSAGNSSPRNNSHVLMHRGWLISVMAIDSGKVGGGIEVYDFANPRNPVLKKTKCDSSTNPLRESHTYGVWRNDADGKEYLALTSTKGVQIWDVTNLPTTLTLVNDYSLPSVTANDYADGSWWLSWVGKYIYVGGSGNGMYTVDASNPASMKLYDPYNLCWHGVNGCVGAPLKPVDIGDFRTNVVQVVGNVMLVGGADTAPGMAMFDVTDPLKPVYRQKISTPSQSYNYQLAGKWGDVNTLLAFKGTGSSSGLQIIQVSNDLRTLTSLYNNSALVNSKIGYLNYQDGYFHGGYSSNYRKIDVRNPTAPVVTKTGKSSQAGVDEDFATVLGNVVFTGNDHDGSKEGEHNGSAIYPHQTNPDTTPPAVTYITPNVGATGQKASVRVGVIFSDNVDLRYLNTTTFAVKNAGTGATLPGRYTAQFHYANFEPNTPFAAGTTYNVVITGVRDWAGNAMTTTFNSSFTITGTGATPPANCNIGTDSIKNVGQTVTITPTGCTGSPAPTCTIDWGDGSQSGSFPCATPSGNTHVYSSPLHYLVAVHATNASGEMTFSRRQTVINAPTSGQPTRSTPIFFAKPESGVWGDSNARVFVANPDRNSVRGFTANVTTGVLTAAWEKDVGRSPRTLAARPGTNQVWIVSQDEPSIKVMNGVDGTFLGIIVLPDASRPYGIAFAPTGSHAYVTLQGSGKLIKIDAAFAMANQNQQKYSTPDPTVGTIVLGGQPRGVAVSGDGLKAYVTRFITPVSLNVADNKPTSAGGLVNVVNTGAMTLAGGITILNDTDPVHDTESNGRGMANYLQGITLSPDGTRATVASKKDNIYRGSFVDGQALTFENTVRTMVSILDLTQALPATDVFAYRRDINNADMANSAVYNSNGDWVFIAHHNNQVSVYDALNYNATNVMALETTGMTPQGLAISNDNKFLYVFAFMSRTVEVYNVSAVGGTNNFPKIQSISAQTSEALPTGTPKQDILAGKKIFYNSDDTKMSRDGYIACSSCHLDGGADETVFDFTNGGEGLRNTITLLGRRGMGHGPVHWSANFDEIQDFEHPIRDLFGGTGFMLESDFEVGTRNTPLGTTKAGVSDDLDNLAAYVASLSIVPRSPHRNADGTLTDAAAPTGSAVRGRTAFAATRTGLASGATSCASCHSGRDFTDSASKKLHNVGTLATGSGKRLGGTLTGIDTPSLLGIWNTAPYLHNGSAATIMNVLNNTTHVGTVSAQEKTDLAEYMRQVDDMSRDFMFSNLIVNDTTNAALWSFKGDLGPGDFAYPDRAYTWTYVPSDTRGGAAPFITMKDSVWIRTPAGSKSFGPVTATIATFNVDKPVDVYLVMDERQFIGCPANTVYPYLVPPQPARNSACIAVPSWLSSDGWVRQDGQGSAGDLEHAAMHVVQTDGYQFDMWVYKKQFGAGTVTLKAAPNGNVPFYSVVVKATPSGSLPPVPTGVAATDNEDRQSTITWMASTGAEDYTVQKSGSPSGPFTDIPGAQHITATSYVATGLTNGITYYFAVKANNDFGSSAASASDAGTPNCSAPASPSGLVANAGQGQVTLSWTAISGATGYNIKRSTTQGASDPPTVASPVTNLYTDRPLTAQTTYYFRVSATNACGESNDSAETEATPTAVTTTDALLVVKDRDTGVSGVQLTPGDVLIQTHLADLGYNIAVVQDSASTSASADNKAVVFISRSVGSGNSRPSSTRSPCRSSTTKARCSSTTVCPTASRALC